MAFLHLTASLKRNCLVLTNRLEIQDKELREVGDHPNLNPCDKELFGTNNDKGLPDALASLSYTGHEDIDLNSFLVKLRMKWHILCHNRTIVCQFID